MSSTPKTIVREATGRRSFAMGVRVRECSRGPRGGLHARVAAPYWSKARRGDDSGGQRVSTRGEDTSQGRRPGPGGGARRLRERSDEQVAGGPDNPAPRGGHPALPGG